jgi:hypothetical protein
MRLAGLTFAGAVSLAASAVSGAAPLAPPGATAQQPNLIPVAEGCGPGWHRTYRGECVPNRTVRIYRHHPRDYVVEEDWDEYHY